MKQDYKQRAGVEAAPSGRPPKNLTHLQWMERKLKTGVDKAIYKLWGQIVEACSGRSKTVDGLAVFFALATQDEGRF